MLKMLKITIANFYILWYNIINPTEYVDAEFLEPTSYWKGSSALNMACMLERFSFEKPSNI